MTYYHNFCENILLTISLLRFYEHIHLSWKHVVHPARREKWYRKAQRILHLWHLADIYGTQTLLLLENGLFDPENEKTSMLNLTVFKMYGKTLHKSFTTDSKNGDQIFS